MAIALTIIIFGTLFYWVLADIRYELRYRNTLLKEQNSILKNK